MKRYTITVRFKSGTMSNPQWMFDVKSVKEIREFKNYIDDTVLTCVAYDNVTKQTEILK